MRLQLRHARTAWLVVHFDSTRNSFKVRIAPRAEFHSDGAAWRTEGSWCALYSFGEALTLQIGEKRWDLFHVEVSLRTDTNGRRTLSIRRDAACVFDFQYRPPTWSKWDPTADETDEWSDDPFLWVLWITEDRERMKQLSNRFAKNCDSEQ